MEDYTFKKSTCERYDLRWGQYGWAIFTIDEKLGLFNCQSDHGDYSYMWPNHGRKSFKHFILELAKDTHYLLKKVSKPDTFDFQKALVRWKREIIRVRRDRECTKEQARDAWEAIDSLEDYSGSPDVLLYQICDSRAINEIWDEPWYVFEIDREYSPQALAFAHEVMPMFANILSKEIEGEDECIGS